MGWDFEHWSQAKPPNSIEVPVYYVLDCFGDFFLILTLIEAFVIICRKNFLANFVQAI